MQYIKSTTLFLLILFAASCAPVSKKNAKTCFLESYLNSEVEMLNKSDKVLQKAIYYEGKMNDTLLAQPIWKNEMKLFYSNLPDSQELISKYKLTKDSFNNRYKEQYVQVIEDKSMKTIELLFIDMKIISVRMNVKSLDNLSSQEMSLNYNAQKSISTSGDFALLNGKKKEYEIFGEIK